MKRGLWGFQTIVWTTAFLLCGISVSQAQVSSGSVGGVVTDPSHAGVPGAVVTLVSPETGAERSTKTGSNGNYSFPTAPAGIYAIRVEAPGFRTSEVTNLEVQVAQAVKRDIELVVG